MTTATTHQTPPVRATRTTEAAIADFDTRLTLAGVSIDVLMSLHGDHGEASDAASEAIAEAAAYAAAPATAKPVLAQPETFTSDRILRRAGELIRKQGWHQGGWASEQGALCAWGAIRLASEGDRSAERDAVLVLLDRIRAEFGDDGWSVSGWNDASARTLDDVLTVLG